MRRKPNSPIFLDFKLEPYLSTPYFVFYGYISTWPQVLRSDTIKQRISEQLVWVAPYRIAVTIRPE
jgi:hypothetical protein